MISKKKVLAIIPARGGSKGIKDKNIISLNGKPLISYTIDAAKKSKYIDDIVLSTDSQRIADVAAKYGAEVPFIRPTELATDRSKTIDVVLHAINYLRNEGRFFDTLILLQPTSPLRTKEDIDCALEEYIKNNYKSLSSISQVKEHPILIRSINENGELSSLLNENSTVRRQDLTVYYRINGSIYINDIDEIDESTSFNDNTIPFIMDPSHSIDIDDPIDLLIADYYLKKMN